MKGAAGRVLATAMVAVALPVTRSLWERSAAVLPLRNLHERVTKNVPCRQGSSVQVGDSSLRTAFIAQPLCKAPCRPLVDKKDTHQTLRSRVRSGPFGLRFLSMKSTDVQKSCAPPIEPKSQAGGDLVLLVNKVVYQETLQCPKLGWHRRRRLVQSALTEAEALLARQGEEIESIFLSSRYGDNVLEIEPSSLRQQATDTATAMRGVASHFKKEVPGTKNGVAVTQATFIHGECVARADAVEYVGDDQWDVLEVKSCTDKNHLKYLMDLAFTVHAAMESGVKVRCALMVVINSDFRLGMDDDAIFKVLNCTEDLFKPDGPIATLQGGIADRTSLPHVAQVTSEASAPAGVLTPSCKQCPLFRDCVPPSIQHPIWHLPRLTGKRFDQVAAHSLDILQVENDLLTVPQQKHRRCVVEGVPVIGRKGLRKGLNALQAPLYFLDFESFSSWRPTLPDQPPLEQVVSQYSLHESAALDIDDPESLQHKAFLGTSRGDFRRELLDAMLTDLGDKGSIVVYSPYEKTQLSKMASLFPDRQDELEALIARLVDLEPLIRQNVQHPDFQGRTSLKVTLPVLVPSYGGRYKALNINNGALAAAAFQRIRGGELSEEEEATVRAELLEYCKLDTLAMVELLLALRRLADQN